MDLLQEHTEIALLFVQSLDQRDRVIRGADYAELVFHEPCRGILPGGYDETGLVVVQVV